jgi:hypothetical protein
MTDPKPPGDDKVSDGQVSYGQQSLHETIQQQVAELLASADLSEEEKQQILIAMSCPCCGAGGLSLSIKLKDRPGF